MNFPEVKHILILACSIGLENTVLTCYFTGTPAHLISEVLKVMSG
jgi:hypothetical protein